MPVIITDEVLSAANLSEREAKIEIACRLFAAEKLDKWPAAKLAGLSRNEFEGELRQRGLPVIIYTEEKLQHDLEALKWMEEQDRAGRK